MPNQPGSAKDKVLTDEMITMEAFSHVSPYGQQTVVNGRKALVRHGAEYARDFYEPKLTALQAEILLLKECQEKILLEFAEYLNHKRLLLGNSVLKTESDLVKDFISRLPSQDTKGETK